MRGGIAVYAGQFAERLRSEGHEVAVASPEPSGAEYVLDVRKRGAGVRLARLVRRFDRLVVQFQPEMLGDPGTTRLTRGRSLLRLGLGLRAARSAELYIHEVDPGSGPLAPLVRALTRLVFAPADRLTVHTQREYEDLSQAFGIAKRRIRVVSQGEYLQRRTETTQATARATLGLPIEQLVFLAIGFLHPRKGFDLAIRAFAEVRSERARLYVVGSMWREDDVSRAHVAQLRELAGQVPEVELREGYLSDEEFDRWIVAADALVLPYRSGWSSNVMERGLLYERQVIMSDVGGMSEQGIERQGVTLVHDDAQLVSALRQTERGLLGIP
jgi:glycosyltransferase involved in cell wall biosynthesis